MRQLILLLKRNFLEIHERFAFIIKLYFGALYMKTIVNDTIIVRCVSLQRGGFHERELGEVLLGRYKTYIRIRLFHVIHVCFKFRLLIDK